MSSLSPWLASRRVAMAARAIPEITRSELVLSSTLRSPLTGASAWAKPTSEGGRFRLLRHHARGGIGVVFVALDSELHREVALKQIQPQHADDPTSRARFLIEAEVTGRLEHPGVVPVYGLGQNDQGRPFYAMRFVRGQSLKEAIESFHQADHQPGRDPAERTLALRSSWAGSSTSATRSPMPTAGACSIAISSRRISCSAPTARPWSSTGAWPRSWAATTRRRSRPPR